VKRLVRVTQLYSIGIITQHPRALKRCGASGLATHVSRFPPAWGTLTLRPSRTRLRLRAILPSSCFALVGRMVAAATQSSIRNHLNTTRFFNSLPESAVSMKNSAATPNMTIYDHSRLVQWSPAETLRRLRTLRESTCFSRTTPSVRGAQR
jgi:hypothetical protein